MRYRSKRLFILAVGLALPAVAKAGNVLLELPSLVPGTTPSIEDAYGLSADGNHVVGAATFTAASKPVVATEWNYDSSTQSLTAVNLGALATAGTKHYEAYATAVNADGTLVSGTTTVGTSSTLNAAIWSTGTTPATITNLGEPAGSGNQASQVRISEDGQTVLASGGAYQTSGTAPVVLNPPTTIPGVSSQYVVGGIGDASTDNVSRADAPGGPIITGQLYMYSGSAQNPVQYQQPYEYSKATGFIGLGTAIQVPSSAFSYVGENYSPTLSTPISGNGEFISSRGINPTTGKEDGFEYNTITGNTTWFNSTNGGLSIAFSPTAITDDGSYVVGRDENSASTDSGWIWSASTGIFENINTFLSQYNLTDPNGAADVYGVALNGDVLTLTGLDSDQATTNATSFFAQVTVPEPSSLTLLTVGGLGLLRRRRKLQLPQP